MKISGICNSNPESKEITDYNGLLQFLMEGDRIYIQERSPIIVEKGEESSRRFYILNVTDGGKTLFDVSEGKTTGEFERFMTNARRAIAHPELLF